MNPKMTEFLAQDRIAGFRNEAAGHHVEKRPMVTRPKAPDAASQHLTAITLAWHRIRRAIAV